jgi:hypothetical protein
VSSLCQAPGEIGVKRRWEVPRTNLVLLNWRPGLGLTSFSRDESIVRKREGHRCWKWYLGPFFFSILGFELRVLCLLPLDLTVGSFALVIFVVGSHFYNWAHLDLSPPYTSCITGMTGVHNHVQLFNGWDEVSLTFLPTLASNCDPPDLCLPSG